MGVAGTLVVVGVGVLVVGGVGVSGVKYSTFAPFPVPVGGEGVASPPLEGVVGVVGVCMPRIFSIRCYRGVELNGCASESPGRLKIVSSAARCP